MELKAGIFATLERRVFVSKNSGMFTTNRRRNFQISVLHLLLYNKALGTVD